MISKKAQRSIQKGFIKSWTSELKWHDNMYDLVKKDPGYPRFDGVDKFFANKRKRILWNITRAKNLLKAI